MWSARSFPGRIRGFAITCRFNVSDRGLFQFRYAPKYHADPQYRESEVVFVPEHLSRDCIKLNWVMDGGGILVDDRVVVEFQIPPARSVYVGCVSRETCS